MGSWKYGSWTALSEIGSGTIFETREGERFVKSAYKPKDEVLSVLSLGDGTEWFWPRDKEVRAIELIPPPEV